jgi:glyoxylase-like metal-dependent hydrolase (beta-lactamase superfamily II)
LICPGHGPLVEDPAAKLDEYVAHRRERERRLLDALADGKRSTAELLDAAWPEVPDVLRPAAAVTLAAHLDKLADEGKLPWGVERPAWPVSPRG